MQFLIALYIILVYPNIALAKADRSLGETFIVSTGMVLLVGAIAAIIRFFKK
jgi:hypothetical protein